MGKQNKIGTKEQTELLIELVQRYPPVYDKRSAYHKDAVMINNIWQSITDAMDIRGLTVYDCKTRWRTLRDTYVRKKRELTKPKSASAAEKIVKWQFMDIMGFLDCFTQEARTESNMYTATEEVSDNESQTDASFDEGNSSIDRRSPSPDVSIFQSTSSTILTEPSPMPGEYRAKSPSSPEKQSSYTGKGKGKRRKQCMPAFDSSFIEMAQAQSKLKRMDESVTCTRDALDVFFESCALRAKNLPKERQGWLQMQCISSPLVCYPMRLRPGQDIKQTLLDFVAANDLRAAFVLTCCGSVVKATLRMANLDMKMVEGHFEIVSLVGTLSGSEKGHLHISLSDADGHVIGGHVLGDLIVHTTAEIVIGECVTAKFERKEDEKTGFTELHVSKRTSDCC